MKRLRLVLLLFVIGGIKLTFFFLDPVPKFFFGDSSCYIYCALTGWIPEDRSFSYGYMIGPLIEWSDSLVPLLLVQLAASAGSAFLLGLTLERCFSVRRSVAWAAAILCSVEPIQLLYERYVMTETVSLFLFAVYVLAAFEYVRRQRGVVLVVLQILGALVVSLRLSYLPVVVLNALLLPLLGAYQRARRDAPGNQAELHVAHPAWKRPRFRLWVVFHLAISVLVTVALHSGLKALYSDLTGRPPGYHASEGFFLLATWAPIVAPEDFPLPEARSVIFDNPRFDLKDRHLRTEQLFEHDGLCWRIRFALEAYEAEDDDMEKNGVANEMARSTAMNVLRRDPMGVVRLSLQSLADYFDVGLIRKVIENDLAMDEPQVARYREFVRDTAEAVPGPLNPDEQPLTLLKGYYRAMLPWYWLLFAIPLVSAGALVLTQGFERLLAVELFMLTAVCVSVAGFLSVLPIVRYLHPVAWLAFYPLALVVDRWMSLLNRPMKRLLELK